VFFCNTSERVTKPSFYSDLFLKGRLEEQKVTADKDTSSSFKKPSNFIYRIVKAGLPAPPRSALNTHLDSSRFSVTFITSRHLYIRRGFFFRCLFTSVWTQHVQFKSCFCLRLDTQFQTRKYL